ncbi:MAG: putative bifunctional diguanylate cyclase/phosphodiesterase [Sandaracinaceae bacterium]
MDDEPSVGRAFARTARAAGLEVDSASSGEEALGMVQRQRYAAVVTDLRMPGMDGLSLIERASALQPDLAFVIVTGLPDLDLRRQHAVDASIVGIHPKPWDGPGLLASVERAIDLHRRRSQPRTAFDGAPRYLLLHGRERDAAEVRARLERVFRAEVDVTHRLRDAEMLLGVERYDVVVAEPGVSETPERAAVTSLRQSAPESLLILLSEAEDGEAADLDAIRMGADDCLVPSELTDAQLARAVAFARERRRGGERLAHIAHVDGLTGLANRLCLKTPLAQARARARARSTMTGLLYLDLDRFKRINDTLGTEAGDILLQQVASRLLGAVRGSDTVARIGGDEFVIVLEGLTCPDDAQRVADRCLGAMQAPFELPQASCVVTSSVGIAVAEVEEVSTVDDLLRTADAAVSRAKAAGRNQVARLRPTHQPPSTERLELERELRAAAEEGSFELHYQPQFAVGVGTLVGFAALLRWTRCDGTRVSPGTFVPLLEDLGLIADVGLWVVREAAGQLARWQEAGLAPGAQVAVNVSGHQFEREGFVEQMADALRAASLDPARFEVEITESVLMQDTERTNDTLARLKELGVRIAIDDFGTGYSSLSYLERFAVDTLKIDRCFVEPLRSPTTSSLASAIIGLGHRLGVELVAEGVEEETQLRALSALRCDVAQGYLLGRPMPAEKVSAMLTPRPEARLTGS